MKKITFLLLCGFLQLLSGKGISQEIQKNSIQASLKNIGTEHKMLHISANLVVNTAEELLSYVDRAKASGANTVLYSDSKLNSFGLNGTAGNRWDTEMQKFVSGVKERGMKIHFITIVMGFANSLIASDVHLTTGYPINNQELIAQNGSLIPVNSSNMKNGGFELFENDSMTDWTFQDAIGERTFVDTEIKRSGNASLRAEARNGEMSRIITSFDVKPFHQYVLRFWIKTENLSAANLLAVIRDDNNKDRNLTNLRMSLPNGNGRRKYFNSPNDLTLDWTEMRIAFNSLEAIKVNLGLSVFGGTSGKIWWDDVEVLDTPSLNWINRDDLPVTAQLNDGTPLTFGTDLPLIEDSLLGQNGYGGSYDTHHQPPTLSFSNNSKIKEGDIVQISGYHALPTANAQVSASWNHPKVYENMRTIHQRLQDTYEPDGFLLNYSEIRTGGWEPLDLQYENSGAALAASIKRAYDDLFEIAPNAEHFFWADMVDPYHNAIANYYQINNTLDKSWTTLDPDRVTIATWWEGQKIIDQGSQSLPFFEQLGFKQILGAFYDADVQTNYDQWNTAANGVENINGSMYATWVSPRDFSQIENFGTLWWGPETDTGDELEGKIFRLENKATGQWIRTKSCSSDYTENVPLVLTSTLNTGNCTVFEFIPTDEGYYYIQNRATNGRYRPKNCSNLANDSVEIVQVSEAWYGWCEQWKLVDAGDGYYRIQNRQTENWFRSQGCSSNTDESVSITQVSQSYTGDCTKWRLIEVKESELTKDENPTDFKIYPNPSNGIIYLQESSPNTEDIQIIEIYSIEGKKILTINKSELSENDNTINLSGQNTGIYLLKMISKDNKSTFNRFVLN